MHATDDTIPMPDIEYTHLGFSLPKPGIFDFVLQEAFQVACLDGGSIREFLCIQMQICGDYTEKRIQTIFLNGKPVDDVDVATLHEGERLAMSAAMPGLVGATMRKQGFFAKMRNGISYDAEGNKEPEIEKGKPCLVTVKLFNFLAVELARDFLIRGVFFPAERFRTLLKRRPESFFEQVDGVTMNGSPVAIRELAERLPSRPHTVFMQLTENDS